MEDSGLIWASIVLLWRKKTCLWQSSFRTVAPAGVAALVMLTGLRHSAQNTMRPPPLPLPSPLSLTPPRSLCNFPRSNLRTNIHNKQACPYDSLHQAILARVSSGLERTGFDCAPMIRNRFARADSFNRAFLCLRCTQPTTDSRTYYAYSVT